DAGLERDIFNPRLCFFSFEHGYCKPDPRFARLLTLRLRARGILPGETIMVGNHIDNDVVPARRNGWHSWQLTDRPKSALDGGGDWNSFLEYVNNPRHPQPRSHARQPAVHA